jgi:hypothetical protein
MSCAECKTIFCTDIVCLFCLYKVPFLSSSSTVCIVFGRRPLNINNAYYDILMHVHLCFVARQLFNA